MKYIIDMDIGTDIDDAFALLLAMHLKMDVIGVTTVFENTEARARIAKKMLKLYGKGYENIPVFAGYGVPLAKETLPKSYPYQYTPDLEDAAYAPDSTDPADAVDFIIDACRKYRDDLTVLAIGPFINMARVIEKDPEALNLAAEVIIMGGCYFKQYTDWNVVCDVEAAKLMFDNVERLVGIGSDVTHLLPLSESDNAIIFGEQQDATLQYVKELYRLGKKANHAIGFLHDPLVVYYAYDKTICACEEGAVAVITEGYARAFTINVMAYKVKHAKMNPAYRDFDFTKTKLLARSVDVERMMTEFMKCFQK